MAQLSGLLRHEIMDFMFADPTMLDDLDFLYKSDTARKLMFYYQAEEAAEGAAAEGGGQAAAGAPAGGERAGKSSKKSIRDGEIEQKGGTQLCDQIETYQRGFLQNVMKSEKLFFRPGLKSRVSTSPE